jgi:hypothetical protein
MKKLALLLISALSLNLFGQISEGGMPPSFKNSDAKSNAQIPVYSLAELDTAQLLSYDREHPTPMRYAVVNKVTIDLKAVSTSTYSDNYKGTIWRYRIEAKDARSIQLIFSKYRVPDGAQLFIYNENYTIVNGAYTTLNVRDDLSFVVGDFPGNYLIIEYFEPADAQFEGELVIGGISQAYIDIFDTKSANADSYNLININCKEGKEWQDQKHSVCKLTFSEGSSSYLCTGALINNTASDGTPYFLTANHCISSNDVANTVVAFFNYETPGCTATSSYVSQTLSGAILETTGNESDYSLLRFTDNVPTSYKPYFAGWDVTGEVTDSTAGIHHPSGKIKKISIDYDPSESYESTISWEGGSVTPAGTHWGVIFDEGTTYGGSSGSPLFDENKRIIGQLHGGGITDYYGKLSYSWNHPGSAYATLNLKSFLDPGSSNITTLNGYYPSDNLPDPQFLSDFKTVCTGSPIEINGFSAFSPSSWDWTFSPSTIEYKDGTSNTSQNPKVAFLADGTYNAKLSVQNSAGNESLTLHDIFSAGSALTISAYPSGLADSCLCNFSGMTLKAFGADAYLWTLSETADDYFYIENNTANPAVIKLINGVELTSNVNIDLTLRGTQGTCENSIAYSLPMEAQNNDLIKNAIPLSPGVPGTYSNSCASIETGEPMPPFGACTGQLTWCDEFGTGKDYVANTVWFTYSPTSAQTVDIFTTGLDDQMAVYKAYTYTDILTGNYSIIAANDDYSNSDFNAYASNLKLSAGRTYWIQVDGSAGNTTGTFSIMVSIKSGLNDAEAIEEEIKIYPIPACDNVTIESNAFTGPSPVSVELFNSSGAKVFQQTYTEGSGLINLPLTAIPSGIYMARITCNNKVSTVKIIK